MREFRATVLFPRSAEAVSLSFWSWSGTAQFFRSRDCAMVSLKKKLRPSNSGKEQETRRVFEGLFRKTSVERSVGGDGRTETRHLNWWLARDS